MRGLRYCTMTVQCGHVVFCCQGSSQNDLIALRTPEIGRCIIVVEDVINQGTVKFSGPCNYLPPNNNAYLSNSCRSGVMFEDGFASSINAPAPPQVVEFEIVLPIPAAPHKALQQMPMAMLANEKDS